MPGGFPAGMGGGFPGGMPGMPGGFPAGMGGGFPGGMPGGFPAGMGGGFPGGASGGASGGAPGGFPGSAPGGVPGNVDFSKILNVSMSVHDSILILNMFLKSVTVGGNEVLLELSYRQTDCFSYLCYIEHLVCFNKLIYKFKLSLLQCV